MIRPFFDDGSDAAGDEVILADPDTRAEISRHRIPAAGHVIIPHPASDRLVIYAGVPGHRAEVRLRGDPAAAAVFAESEPASRSLKPARGSSPVRTAVETATTEGNQSLVPWLLGCVLVIAGGGVYHFLSRRKGDR